MGNFVHDRHGRGYAHKDAEMLEEGIIEQRQAVVFDSSDEDLISTADKWLSEAKTMHDYMQTIQTRNENYYLGHQLDEERLGDYQAKIVLNKVYQTLRTILPRATEQLPAPMISMAPADDPAKEIDNREFTDNLEEVMLALAEEHQLTHVLKDFLLFQQLYHVGCLKFGYDEEEGIWVKNLRPQRIFIPPYDYLEYVMEYHEMTIEEMIEEFPEKEEVIKKNFLEKPGSGRNKLMMGTRVGFMRLLRLSLNTGRFTI